MTHHLSGCPQHWNMTQACTCAPSPERVVVSYKGANLIDAGSVIRVRFTAKPIPYGLRTKLRDVGFATGPNGSMQRISNTNAIFRTRALLHEYCGETE